MAMRSSVIVRLYDEVFVPKKWCAIAQIAISVLASSANAIRSAVLEGRYRFGWSAACTTASSAASSLSVAMYTCGIPVADCTRRTCAMSADADCSTPGCERRTRRKSVRRQCTAMKGSPSKLRSTNCLAAAYVCSMKRTFGLSTNALVRWSWSVLPKKPIARCDSPCSSLTRYCAPASQRSSETPTLSTPLKCTCVRLVLVKFEHWQQLTEARSVEEAAPPRRELEVEHEGAPLLVELLVWHHIEQEIARLGLRTDEQRYESEHLAVECEGGGVWELRRERTESVQSVESLESGESKEQSKKQRRERRAGRAGRRKSRKGRWCEEGLGGRPTHPVGRCVSGREELSSWRGREGGWGVPPSIIYVNSGVF
eukprot:scaffold173161_cov27-Tisochrysis_lutea.AAC.1